MQGLKIQLVTFLAGTCLMVMELTGSRVLAPYVGTSIFVWSNLIGVILGALSLGAWLGGRLADRLESMTGLAVILLAAATTVMAGTVFKDALMYFLHSRLPDIQARTFWGTIILFGAPSLFLGMVTPYAIRISLAQPDRAGRTAGHIVALSTLGSITGTFAAGLFLIPNLGSTRVQLLVITLLAILSIGLAGRACLRLSLVGFILVVAASIGLYRTDLIVLQRNSGVVDVETKYNRVWIYNKKDSSSHSIKVMRINNAINSAIYSNSNVLVYDYLKFFNLANQFGSASRSILMIGGGGFSYPMDVVNHRPSETIDVVELDPGLEVLAREHFRLVDNPRLRIFNEDGRVFLNRVDKIYDVILIDAFQSLSAIPFQLTTIEAVQRIHDILAVDGVVMVNIIGTIFGPDGRFLRSELHIYSLLFENVYLYPLSEPGNGNVRQNIILVATNNRNKPDQEAVSLWAAGMLGSIWDKEVECTEPLLTDDYAPVEYLAWLGR